MKILKRSPLIVLLIVLLAISLPPTFAQNPPAAPTNISTHSNQGRPTISWSDDPNAQYYHLYIANSDYSIVFYDNWLAKISDSTLPQITCPQDYCVFMPNIYLQSGSYIVWLQSWGNGNFSSGGHKNLGWNSSNFVISVEKPSNPSVNLTGLDTGWVAASWNNINTATWYHIWLGTGSKSNPPYQKTLFDWHSAEMLGCGSSSTQVCTLPATNLPDGNYELWMQVWGPAGFSTSVNDSWYQAASFTVNNNGVPLPTPIAPTPIAPTPIAPTPIAPTPIAPTPIVPTQPPSGQSQSEADVIALLNAERANMGMGCVSFNSYLREAARVHSTDMRDNDFMSHTGSDGSDPAVRARNAGYQGQALAENVARGGIPTGQDVYNGWYNSPGHYANMFKTDVNEIGVAVIEDGNQGYYWTMVLGYTSGAC